MQGSRAASTLALRIACALMTTTVVQARAQAQADEPAGAGASAPVARVNIQEYRVRGNTVLEARAIEQAVSPYLGPGRTLADVEAARAALQAAYQQRGYQSVYVDLPGQQVSGGVVLLQVTQTRVGTVQVVGARYHDPARLRAAVPALAAGQVPDFTRAQAELAALNRTARRQVVPLVKPGAGEGTMDVDLKVEDASPWRVSATVNNDHSVDTTPTRSILTVGHENLWQREHSASLTWFAAPQDRDEASVWSGSYRLPLGGPDGALEVSGYRSDSNVVSSGQTQVTGKGHALGVKFSRTLPVSGPWWHQVAVGVDFKDMDEAVALTGMAADFAPLKYAPVSLAYSGFRQGERHQFALGLQAVFGARSLLGYGSGADAFDWKRAYADASFFVLKADVSDTLTLASGAQWFAKVSAQLTDQPLVSGEQFAAGGMYTTRGYRSAEAIGDYGAMFTLEWRSAPVARWGLRDWRFHGYLDGAWLGLRRPLPEQAAEASLAALGFGTSFQVTEHFNVRLDYGHSLLDGPTTTRGADRLHISVGASY
jgi:hemolysin activation/secretion protein